MTIVPHLKTLLEAGFSPVVFCRFIATAEYLTNELRGCLPGCSVECVTGTLPPDERAARVEALAAKPTRVLVCTDCLSEGINLQSAFDAVIHYDLSWNPTRHEQREGRVDRFGQSASEVRVITFWGEDSPVDRRIIEVLLRKHRAIRDQLGVSVPVPQNYDLLLETLIRDDLMTQPAGRSSSRQLTLPGLKLSPGRRQADAGRGLKALHAAWDEAAALVRRGSNTVFAQRGIHVEEVAGLWARTAEAMGLSGTVAAFARKAWERLGGVITDGKDGSRPAFTVFFSEDVRRRHPGLDLPADRTRVVFEQPARPGEIYLCRTHAWVESLAAYLSRSALDRAAAAPLVARCGVMRTRAVNERVILLLCRFRFLLRAGGAVGHAALAEECACLALNGITSELRPLPQDRISSLLQAEPGGNVDAGQGRRILKQVLQAAPSFLPLVRAWRTERAGALLEEHCRAREAAKARGPRCSVEPQGEPDILGVYVYLPVVQ